MKWLACIVIVSSLLGCVISQNRYIGKFTFPPQNPTGHDFDEPFDVYTSYKTGDIINVTWTTNSPSVDLYLYMYSNDTYAGDLNSGSTQVPGNDSSMFSEV